MQTASRLDHAAILAHGIVRDLAALYPALEGEAALRTLAVELHRAREVFRKNYPMMGIKFDLAVKERWGADPLLVFEATGASTAEAERGFIKRHYHLKGSNQDFETPALSGLFTLALGARF